MRLLYNSPPPNIIVLEVEMVVYGCGSGVGDYAGAWTLSEPGVWAPH